jgi:hypothetical protein
MSSIQATLMSNMCIYYSTLDRLQEHVLTSGGVYHFKKGVR